MPYIIHKSLTSLDGNPDDQCGLSARARADREIPRWVAAARIRQVSLRPAQEGPVARLVERPPDADHAYATTAYFTIPGLGAEWVVIGGARFDSDYLRRTFFPKMLDDLITYKLGEESKNPLAIAISGAASGHSGSSTASAWTREGLLASSTGWQPGLPEVSRDLDDVFRGLALGIKFQGTSVEAIGRNWAYRSFVILGVVSVLLIGGLGLTYRSVSKEVALARLKSDFVSNVSHELRTPLSLIRLYAETLELGRIRTPDRMQQYYSTIRLESERLTALIDNILDFSRIEAGRKEYDLRVTDMAELVINTLDTYRAQIDEQGFTFEQHIAPDLREILSIRRRPGPQHQGQWPWPVARPPHRGRTRGQGGREEHHRPGQHVHALAPGGNGPFRAGG